MLEFYLKQGRLLGLRSLTGLQETARQALAQINERGYEAELQNKGITQILKIGLAFHEKEVAMASER